MGNEKLFEGHKMLWIYKYKYYTWLGHVMAICLRYTESTCVGAFFVHIAPAHLQAGNIAWSLVFYVKKCGIIHDSTLIIQYILTSWQEELVVMVDHKHPRVRAPSIGTYVRT